MKEPDYLTPERLARDVHARLPEMRPHVYQWGIDFLRSYPGSHFLSGLDDVLSAYERRVPDAYEHLCGAIALRIALLHHQGEDLVPFCGIMFVSQQLELVSIMSGSAS